MTDLRPASPGLAFGRAGERGPLVLALHGIPGSRATFDGVTSRLARDFRVIVPDLRGFGGSPSAPPHFHAAEHAEEVLRLLVSLGEEDVHLVGFDFGGPTAVLLARRLGARVRSITVAATNLFPDTPIPPPLRLAKVPLLGWLFFRVALGYVGQCLMYFAAVRDRRAFPFGRYRATLDGDGARTTREIFYASMRDLPGLYADVAGAARELALPAVVLWGDRDPFFPLPVGERTAAALGAELRVLPGCGHFVPEERPAEVADAVAALILRSTR